MRVLALFAILAMSFAYLSGCSKGQKTRAAARIQIQAKGSDLTNEQMSAEIRSLQTISRKHLSKTETIEIREVSETRMIEVLVFGADIPSVVKKCRAIVTEYVALEKEGIEKSVFDMPSKEMEK